jgi:hypothetical protein
MGLTAIHEVETREGLNPEPNNRPRRTRPLLPDAVRRLFHEARKILEEHDVVWVGEKEEMEKPPIVSSDTGGKFRERLQEAPLTFWQRRTGGEI